MRIILRDFTQIQLADPMQVFYIHGVYLNVVFTNYSRQFIFSISYQRTIKYDVSVYYILK